MLNVFDDRFPFAFPPPAHRVLRVNDSDDDPSTSDSSSSDDDQHLDLKTLSAQGDLPQDFWQVRDGKEQFVPTHVEQSSTRSNGSFRQTRILI